MSSSKGSFFGMDDSTFLGKGEYPYIRKMKFILSFCTPYIFFLRFSYKLFKFKAINKYERE